MSKAKNNNLLLFEATILESFRDPIEYFQEGGLFVGRSVELSKLRSIIVNRSSATVLLSGSRGSGKTSLVRKAVSEAKNSAKSQPFVVDVPIISAVEDAEKKRGNILRGLVRSLYFTTQDNTDLKLKEADILDSLYNRTYYSEEKQTRSTAFANAQTNKEILTRKKEVKTTYDFSQNSLNILVASLFGVSLAPLVYVLNIISNNWVRAGVAAVYLIIWLSSFVKVNKTDSKSSEEHQEESLNETLSDSSATIVDLSNSYFETHLKRFLRSNNKTKFVFVFDELDKEVGIPAEDIIKCLKNLFTLSNGVYIFITAEEQYHKLSNPNNITERGPDCTIFTDTIFLNQLRQEQINEIVEKILVNIDYKTDDIVLDKLKHYLGWASKNVAFDLYKKLDELVDYETKSKISIPDFTKVGLDEQFNIDRDWQFDATFQAYVDTVFEGHRHPWNNLYNTVLLDALHAIAARLKEDEKIVIKQEQGQENYWETAKNELKSSRQKSNISLLTKNQQNNIGKACQDLLVGMEANDNFVFAPEIDEEEKTITYRYNGGSFPSKSELKRLSSTLLPYEEEFRRRYREAKSLVSRLEKASIPVEESTKSLLKKSDRINNLQKHIRRDREKSTIVEETSQLLDKINQSIGSSKMPELLRAIVNDLSNISELTLDGTHPKGMHLWDYDKVMSKFYNESLRNTPPGYFILMKADNSTEGLVVLVYDLPSDKKQELINILRTKPTELKTQVIDITYGGKREGNTYSPPGLRQPRVKEDLSNITDVKKLSIETTKSRLEL